MSVGTLPGAVKEQKPFDLPLSLLSSDILEAAPPAGLAGPAGSTILAIVNKGNTITKVELPASWCRDDAAG